MPHRLIQAMIDDGTAELITAQTLDAFLSEETPAVSALFFTGDPEKKLETADVAVVLRELERANPGRLRIAIIDRADEHDLKHRCGVMVLPSVAFFSGSEHLETIPKIQDWAVYAEKLPKILDKASAIAA
ncbi:MAG: hydrogenase accessory protein [Pseudomonadota bacterium]